MSPAGKPLADLTRWNRTGLSRFEYVDGDAAVWLEELRIAMLGLYLREGAPETRLPQHWRDIFLGPKESWPDVAAAADSVTWKRLAPSVPPARETRGRRADRLLRQYSARTDDHAWEINRAFARASHILLGYLNAYANEGYLRTATQWDNLRRLAAMVNYQPAPPASATTMVALMFKEDGTEAVKVPAGLAMKHTPPEGGAPLVFETLEEVDGHPALNMARAVGWNKNLRPLPHAGSAKSKWHLAKDKTLAIGDLAVLASARGTEALVVSSAEHDTEAEAIKLNFALSYRVSHQQHDVRLWVHPADVRLGLRTSKSGQVVLEADEIGGVIKGDLLEVFVNSEARILEVLAAEGGEIVLNMTLPEDDAVIEVRPMLAFALRNNRRVDRVVPETEEMWARTHGGMQMKTPSALAGDEAKDVGLMRFRFSGVKGGRAFARDATGTKSKARVRRKSPEVLPETGPAPGNKSKTPATKTVTFRGKPPKGLKDGDWFVARAVESGGTQALQVKGVRVASGEYHVAFHTAPDEDHDRTEFHGPMALALAHVGHDRNPDPALVQNTVTLQNIPEEARKLIKPGRTVLIRQQSANQDRSVAARVEAAEVDTSGHFKLTLVQFEDASLWPSGAVTFALNTAQVSHGETKDSKILGSGDGERAAQSFDFAIKNVSHIPSTSAECGVAPDMTVTVDGERWEYRDFIDPTAADGKYWSTTLMENGTLQVHFRRRLVSGQNNVIVARYRVGAGVAGAAIPPFSLTKPMKKHRHVAEIFQPFATAGGADREPVSKLRHSAPERLAANGRAVSLSDFEHLATRNAAVLKAKAVMVPTSGPQKLVSLTIALAGGGDVSALASDLTPSITARALPGVTVTFRNYIQLPLKMAVVVRADLSVHNRTDIKAAAMARLQEAFALRNRNFAQTTYVSEVMAALETVPGIENAIVEDFGLEGATTTATPEEQAARAPLRIATAHNKTTAIFAGEHQIAHLTEGPTAAVTIRVESSQ